MRSRLWIGGLCVAVALIAGTVPASAQSSIDRANTKLKVGQTKVWSVTLDTSTILRVRIVTANNADPDILITSNTGETDERIWVDSQSGTVGVEEAVAGLPGGDTYTIAITNFSGQTTKALVSFETVTAPGVAQGSARLLELGQFMDGDRVADAQLAAIQDLVRVRATTKR